ncbi:MAG TPA: hypothetical protein VH518_19165 [Tepidisphaeraceae bacterium]
MLMLLLLLPLPCVRVALPRVGLTLFCRLCVTLPGGFGFALLSGLGFSPSSVRLLLLLPLPRGLGVALLVLLCVLLILF